MNYKILKLTNFHKIFRFTTSFFALSLIVFFAFHPKANATEFAPLCSDVIDDSATGANPITATNLSGNCMLECNDPSITNPNPAAIPPLVRGVDYARHGIDCIRFCDNLSATENGFTTALNPNSSGVLNPARSINCIKRYCHQLPSGVLATATNCNMKKCNLLTANELSNTRFNFNNQDYDPDDATMTPPPHFCDGEGVKCYQFSQEKLPYAKIWPINTMCNIHNCRPPNPSCNQTDEVALISNINTTLRGKTYKQDYERYINGGQSLETSNICTPTVCKPIAKRPYVCNGDNNDQNNPSCDQSGPGSVCDLGYCYKTIDCNCDGNNSSPSCIGKNNTSQPECLPNNPNDGRDPEVEATDTIDSWFYRPAPPNSATYIADSGQRFLHDKDGGEIDASLCYGSSQYKKHWGGYPPFPLNWMGYFHYVYPPTGETTPPRCGMSSRPSGVDGTGYGYLCGTHNNIGRSVNKTETLYHKGYIITRYSEDEGVHKLMVCTRFYNSTHINTDSETCGKRECAVAANFGDWTSKFCGNDVCRVLTVKESNPKECDQREGNDIFDNHNTNKGCIARLGNDGTVNGYLRVRAVKYGNKICTFLDVKGLGGGRFMDGDEKLGDGTCLAGDTGSDGGCLGAKNSNDSRDELTKWRTAMKAHYIDDNQPGDVNGYLDRSKRLFKALDCAKIRPRISPPRMYNLATAENTPRLFIPPIFISQVMVKRDGLPVTNVGDSLGETDFYFPEIEVTFGSIKKKLSLGMNYTGYEIDNEQDPLGRAQLNLVTAEGIRYDVNIFTRKELDRQNNDPLFCLYRTLTDENGAVLEPLRLQCVKRSVPEIYDPAVKKEGIIISRSPVANQLNNSKIVTRYIDFGSNLLNDTCDGDDYCTPSITLENSTVNTPSCQSTIQKYSICSTRDECTQLRVECLQNEIDLLAAKKLNQPLSGFMNKRNYCNGQLLTACYQRKGLNPPINASVTDDSDPFKAVGITNSYGLYPEICLSSGFNTKLRQVIAYQLPNGVMGKCLIDASKKTAGANCDNGGNRALGCPCLEYNPQNHTLTSDQIVRTETNREAGLCIDMPEPGSCPRIFYGTDPDINASIGKNSYGAGGVDLSHQERSNNNDAGHGEFSKAVPGMVDVEGECVGFWKINNNSRKPMRSCIPGNGSNPPYWGTISNPCVRYTCLQVSTAGPNPTGTYQGGYSVGETGDNVGSFHGYATWPAYTKTNDFMELVDSSKYENPSDIACIPGYKKPGSTAHINSTTNKIDYYTGGTSPSRQCNQIGQWGEASNKCERIRCPAINPPDPRNFTENSDAWWDAWEKWNQSKGASFPGARASRSTRNEPQQELPTPESVVTGTCNETLGFFQVQGAAPPTTSCDYLGNWREITNPCSTRCKAVTDTSNPRAADPSNGFAYWDEAEDVSIELGQKDGVFGGCVALRNESGDLVQYVPYPYPPIRNKDGTLLPTAVANDLTRPVAAAPQRLCKNVKIAATDGFTNTWTQPDSSCIGKCPGAATDSRIGVGVTQHPVSYGSGIETINWNDTKFGTYDTQYGPAGSSCGAVEANHFYQGRTNRCYVVRRYCNSNGKWDDPIPSCVARYLRNNADGSTHLGGELEFATYDTGTTPGFSNSLPALNAIDTSKPSATGTCIPGYWEHDSTPGTRGNDKPKRQCVYEDTTHRFIDKVYLKLTNIDNNCKRIECPAQTIAAVTNRTVATNTASKFVTDTTPIDCANNTDLFGSGPYVTCQNDGTWSAVQNATNCRRSCPISNPVYDVTRKVNASGGGDGLFFADPQWDNLSINIKHDQEFSYTTSDSSGHCMKYSYSHRCNDGTWSNATTVGYMTCSRGRRYNWTNLTWEEYDSSPANGAGFINTREGTIKVASGNSGTLSQCAVRRTGTGNGFANFSINWSN